MKKAMTKNLMMAIIVALSGWMVSCDPNDDGGPVITGPIDGSEITTGSITGTVTLDPSVQYTLRGTLSVEEGGTLIIPAGTRIVSDEGTDKYIAVLKGGDIQVNGTAANPVVMTSANQEGGDWGGLVICGEASTSEGVDATAEVGGLIYGGTNDADSSGSINYLILNYGGAQINAESQYNGLTLYAVGSGTGISNVAILNGEDDGVEFFGGTVSVNNLYLENNQDDSVDWTEGWNGTITNTYVLLDRDDYSTVVEADGVNGNPTINNLTAVSTTGGTALQFKKASGATITGLSLIGFDTTVELANPEQGEFSFIQIEGADSDPLLNYTKPATVDVSMFDWVNSGLTVDNTLLQGSLTTTLTLDASVSYNLNSSFLVEDGGILNIPAGTKITARDGGTAVYLAVLKGGKININGTQENPVVMSSPNAEPGDWGGLTICGDAETTEGVNAVAEVGGFVYGGTNSSDSSGSIKNLVILGTGAQINSESQYNGVSFYAVGSETTVENVAVINGADDGVEFFGGSVSVTNLYLENNEDDSVDWTEGWDGSVTNTYISHTIAGFSTAFEADGANANPMFTNVTAISSVNGTALQFKKASGATINNLYLQGYATNVELANPEQGDLGNIIIDGNAATTTAAYDDGTQVDISGWGWIDARL
ncbi:MAG: hypothetical protein WBG71_11975 [Leeuwenhoekiella sp.]